MYDINTVNDETRAAINEFIAIVDIHGYETAAEMEETFAAVCVGEGIDTAACRYLLDMDAE